MAFNDKLLPALGSRFNFTETVDCPGYKPAGAELRFFMKAPNV